MEREEGWGGVGRCWASSFEPGGLRQRGKIEKGIEKDGEVYRDRERDRET